VLQQLRCTIKRGKGLHALAHNIAAIIYTPFRGYYCSAFVAAVRGMLQK
jgi:hypothetical protein